MEKNKQANDVYISIWLLCCAPSKLNATIDLKRFILLSEQKQCLSSFTEAPRQRKFKKRIQPKTPIWRSKGAVLCVCFHVNVNGGQKGREREKVRSPRTISNSSRVFYQSGALHQMVKLGLNWLTMSCVGRLQVTGLTSRLHANHSCMYTWSWW